MSEMADEVRAYALANDNLPMEASGSGLIDSISSTIGKVADFGFNVQTQVLNNQAKSQDLQLKAFLGSLGFQTAKTQALAGAQVAQYQAQGQVAQAQRSAYGGATGLSMTTVLLLLGGAYILSMKK